MHIASVHSNPNGWRWKVVVFLKAILEEYDQIVIVLKENDRSYPKVEIINFQEEEE